MATDVRTVDPARQGVGGLPLPDGRAALLKTCPGLRGWHPALLACSTVHATAVLAFGEHHGALLIEAIEPGGPLVDSAAYPSLDSVGGQLDALHSSRTATRAFPRSRSGSATSQRLSRPYNAIPSSTDASRSSFMNAVESSRT